MKIIRGSFFRRSEDLIGNRERPVVKYWMAAYPAHLTPPIHRQPNRALFAKLRAQPAQPENDSSKHTHPVPVHRHRPTPRKRRPQPTTRGDLPDPRRWPPPPSAPPPPRAGSCASPRPPPRRSQPPPAQPPLWRRSRARSPRFQVLIFPASPYD